MNYFEQSDKITEGLRKSFHCADAKMANRICYGYTTLPNGELTINETEAAVVQWIFNQYLAGDSFGKIATGLEKHAILSPTGKAKWNREAISKLLSNERVVVDMTCIISKRCYNLKYRNKVIITFLNYGIF